MAKKPDISLNSAGGPKGSAGANVKGPFPTGKPVIPKGKFPTGKPVVPKGTYK